MNRLAQKCYILFVSGNDLFITRGNVYCEGEVKRLNITDLLKLNIDIVTKKGIITTNMN